MSLRARRGGFAAIFCSAVSAMSSLLAGPAMAQEPLARVKPGLLQGAATSGGVRVFKGVPYARAPIGDLRWRPPQPAQRWAGVREAIRPGAACMQPDSPPNSFYFFVEDNQSEDCLYLNVWAPEGADKAPVMVWIHGGSLINGSAKDPWYDGQALARRGVVVVTINYRLGVFGYFSHPDLSAESSRGVSGNYGTLDQIAALRWVQQNIAAFGGDPRRVTVFGESAGALSVSHLMASPLAKGLFQAAIAQSVYLPAMPELRRSRYGLAPAEAAGARFGLEQGAPTLADLRAMPAQVLQRASERDISVIGGTNAVVDGWVQPAQIFETFARGQQSRVPFIVGFNSGEQRALDPGALPPFPSNPGEYEARVRAAYGPDAEAFLRLYPAHSVTDSSYAAVRDAYYGWAVELLARAHSKLTPSTWTYAFDHVYRSAAERGLGAFHASEVAFVFGSVGPGAVTLPNWPAAPGSPEDRAMSDVLMDYWVGFAKSGRPASPRRPRWPAFDARQQAWMTFRNGEAITVERPFPGMFEFQDGYMRRLERADRAWSWANMGVAATPLDQPK